MKRLIILAVLHISLCGATAVVNSRPIIGILSQGSPSSMLKYGPTYILASYIKYIESAGGRVVPILVNQTNDYYTDMFNSINGVLFPGGGVDIRSQHSYGYAGAAYMMYRLAMQANKAGDYFPVWGTCLGFEDLMIQTAGKDVLIQGIKSHNTSLTVTLAPDYNESRILNGKRAPAEVVRTLTSVNSTYNNHNLALTPKNFSISAKLKSFFRVLSTSFDDNGVEFVSMVEAYDYPIYGSQWHPEKNQFEWKINACHTLDCVQLSQYMANFFVEEARKNQHHFSSAEEEAGHLIYNYSPVYFTSYSIAFEQAYFFP